MRTLKFILYTILVVCILWAILLTAGPRIITVLIKQNFDNSVLVSGLRITPKLGISADRIDYLRLNTSVGQNMSGFSRAIKLKWGGIFTQEPFVRISVGPTSIQSLGNVSSQELVLTWGSLTDLKNFAFSYTADKLQSNVGVETDVATIDGKFNVADKIFHDIKFDFSKLRSELRGSISADRISGKIELFDAGFDSTKSSFSTDINAFGVFLEDQQLFLPTSDLFLEVEPGNARVILEAANVSNKLYFFEIGSTKIIADGPSLDLDLIESVKIDVTDAFFSLGNQFLKSIQIDSGSGNISIRKDGVIYFDANGIVRKTLLETDNLFIAELPSTTFDISSNIGAFTAEKYINSNMLLGLESSPLSFVEIVSNINFLQQSMGECLKSFCTEISHQINYEMKILDEKIIGFSDCSTLYCSDGFSSHRLETLNTEKFISNVAQTSIINPVLVTLLFSELLSGEKTKQGHVIVY